MTYFRPSVLLFSVFLLIFTSFAFSKDIPNLPPDVDPPVFVGRSAIAKPLPPKDVAPHPFLAKQPSMHVDMYNTGVVELPTPLGSNPIVQSRSFGFFIGMCLNFFYDDDSNLFAFCGEMPDGLLGMTIDFQLALIDPETMDKKASFTLLSLTFADLLEVPMEFGYMNLDHLGRLIVIDDNNHVLLVGITGDEENPELQVLDSIDLSNMVDPAYLKVATVVPDYEGRYWFMSLGDVNEDNETVKSALLGVYDPETGMGSTYTFEGENIGNGLAIGPDGVFVVTDYATYGFRAGTTPGTIEQLWREEYARGTYIKPGVLSWYGSGATPTLMGDKYIVLTDNADEQINLLVYDRRAEIDGDRLVCSVPLFDPGLSANENSPIVHGNSILVQNWYNAPKMIIGDHRAMMAGLWRVDLREDASGCDVVWQNDELAAPGTAKLSANTGLIYSTMQDKTILDAKAWYAMLIDFETGETVNKILLGTGMLNDILYIPVYFGPDGTFYQPALNGFVSIRDGEPEEPEDEDDASEEDNDSGDDDEDGCGC